MRILEGKLLNGNPVSSILKIINYLLIHSLCFFSGFFMRYWHFFSWASKTNPYPYILANINAAIRIWLVVLLKPHITKYFRLMLKYLFPPR